MQLQEKIKKLKTNLGEMNQVAVAFSSGVDSTFLLAVAKEVLGKNVIAITDKSNLFPNREMNQAVDFCKKNDIKHIIIESNELEIEGFKDNPPNRCYLCKKALFKKMLEVANENGIKYLLEGSNIDDLGDYRPGLKAIEELDVCSPLRDADLTKEDIRKLSKEMGLETWDKPSFACLASRFVYGETITKEKLEMVEKAEQVLLDLGIRQFRVRIHNKLARIEVEDNDFSIIINNREQINKKFKEFGFLYVSLDLAGYRVGSMNETLEIKK